MGSKSRITKYIVPIIQQFIDENNIETYIEPFVGGANVIDKVNCTHKIGSDKNKYLIALLKRVRDKLPLLDEVSRELYSECRSNWQEQGNKFGDWQTGNIGFLASYNGRWFDGGYAKSGYEIAKSGQRFRDYYNEAKSNILKQVNGLQGIEFYFGDYWRFNMDSMQRCVIYCDPPYQNTKQYDNAKTFDYDLFWKTMKDWSVNNIVLISEQDAPDDFKCIWEQEVSRSIKANDKSKATEKLFKIKK